jgi:hypothetical protein
MIKLQVLQNWHDEQMRRGFYHLRRRTFISFEQKKEESIKLMAEMDALPMYRRRLWHIYGRRPTRLPEWHDRAKALRLISTATHCLPP